MKQALTLSLAIAVAALAVATVSAQTTSSPAGVLTTATPTTTSTGVKKKPTTATPEMINEAIQRSEARAARETATGRPQQWGSEEPFAYNPAVKRFDKSMQ